MPLAGNMLIAQSGGPTAAVNASLAGALERAMQHGEIGEIYGGKNGIQGVLKGDLVPLRRLFSDEKNLELLRQTPAMLLGSCRKRLSETPDAEYEKILDLFHENNIQYFFYIGGNDSMDTVKKLAAWFSELGEEICAVGVPKTIDNDIACIDHTPGFGSAARFIATSVAEVAADSAIYDLPSVTLVEIMGRNAGWLTAASALARQSGCTAPHIICMPETPFDDERFLSRVEQLQKQHRNVVAAVSEGVRYADGRYVAAAQDRIDAFGHQQLAGVASYLAGMIRSRFGFKVRGIEPNVLQRAAGHLCSETDLLEAARVAAEAVTMAVRDRKTGVMATMTRVSNHPYQVRYDCVPLADVANVEKTVPIEWIDAEQMDIKPELQEYLAPLISDLSGQSGVPEHFRLPLY